MPSEESRLTTSTGISRRQKGKLRQLTVKDVARAYKVPPWLIADVPKPNRIVRAWYWLRGYRAS